MHLLYIADILGTAVFAISGALAAIKYRMDVVGILILGFIVGNGGGTIREAISGNGAVFWIHDKNYIYASIVPAFLVFLYFKYSKKSRMVLFSDGTKQQFINNLLVIADAFGLGIFVVVGAQYAINNKFGLFIAVIMGLITGTGGGIIRDIICNEVPMVFRRDVYLSSAIIGGIVYVLCYYFGVGIYITTIATLIITVVIRLSCYFGKVNLPCVK